MFVLDVAELLSHSVTFTLAAVLAPATNWLAPVNLPNTAGTYFPKSLFISLWPSSQLMIFLSPLSGLLYSIYWFFGGVPPTPFFSCSQKLSASSTDFGGYQVSINGIKQ